MLGLAKLQRYQFAKVYGNFINGEFVQSKADKFYDIKNPVTQELVAKAPQSTLQEFNEAVANSKEAFKTWSRVPVVSNSSLIF